MVHTSFTPLQMRILHHLCDGHNQTLIAQDLKIDRSRIRRETDKMKAKLIATTLAELVHRSHVLGIL